MRKFLLMACVLFGFMACTQETIDEQTAIRVDAPETIKVGFEDSETRIQLNEAQKTVWTKNDLVSVFYKSNANQKWEYRGETGERVAELYRVDASTASSTMNYVVLVYPYSTDYVLSTATGNIETTLPATQHYAAGSYGIGENLMVSRSEFTQFSLKSVCGWLKLQLTGNGEVVKSIKFRGNNGEQVAGLIYVDTATAEATLASEMGGSDDNNAGGNLVFDDTILTEVVLDCGEGVTLGTEATSFYIALPPQTFANGFTVDIKGYGYKPITLSTSNALTIERNTIQPMASVKVEFLEHLDGIANDEIWYTNGSTTESTTPNKADVFGANIISNTYDAEKECWVIKFDGDVTTIGNEAFAGCRSLTSVTIPDSVTTIGESAFAFCSSLTCVALGNNVTTIGNWAFDFCYDLTSITIPDSVTSIGKGAFKSCNSLTEFNGKFASDDGKCLIIDDTLHSFAIGCGVTEYTIPDGITKIGDWAFSYFSYITNIIIPDSVTSIGDGAFYECQWLTDVIIPDNVTTIGYEAFSQCHSITSITIPDSVTSMDHSIFSYCQNLTSVTIGDGVNSISDSAFYSCISLTSVTIGDNVTTIGYDAFSGCSSLTSVTIPDSVTTIENSAFSYCYSLTSVTIPDSVTTIGTCAFYRCSSLQEFNGKFASEDGRCLIIDGTLSSFAPAGLTEYTIPDSVTTIGEWAFCNCSSLTSVTIPDSVTTIGNYAFAYCESLTSVYCKATTPPVGGADMFSGNASGCKIYVPYMSVVEYRSAANWIEYVDDIVAYDFEIGEVVSPNVKPANNEIWYTNGSTTEATTPNYSDVFGANIVSNTYDAEKECWVIKFDGEVTMIGKDAFQSCYSLTSITIPDSVTLIGDGAFEYCSSLTSVTIPDSVTTIGDSAFEYCDSLTSITIPDSVTEIGDWAFYDCSSLTSVTIGDSVTMIGESAFQYCDSLTSVTIPDSVTEIGDGAFYGCRSLTSVTIPDSVTTIGKAAFSGCSSLQEFNGKFASEDGRCLIVDGKLNSFAIGCGATEYTIPDSVTTIGEGAFNSCSSLASVTIPDSVTEIGDNAFSGCTSLTSVTIGDSVTTIGSYAFSGCTGELIINSKIIENNYASEPGWLSGAKFTKLTIGDSVTTIGFQAFEGCSSLTSVTIPDSITTIGDYAFCECYSLTSVTIPDSVTTIGNYAFYHCESLESVTIPDSVTTIGDEAFYYCSSLTSVTIPDSVTTIGEGTFYWCSSLTSVTIGDSVTMIGDCAFGFCSRLTSVTIPDSVTEIGYCAFYDCSSLTSVTIPDSVTTIGDDAFCNCSNLTSVTIPDSVTTIGSSAFCGCSSLQEFNGKFASEDGRCLIIDGTLNSFAPAGLTEYTIPSSVNTIGYGAFANCESLESVMIPDSVTTIGCYAFANCSSLTSIYCKPTPPPSITVDPNGYWYAFDCNASGRKIYVPMESVEAYKSAEWWSEYASDIVGYDF